MPRGIFKRNPHSEETKKKMSKAHKGKPNNRLGTHHSEETRKKISEAQKGKNHHNYGKCLSKETKLKISKSTSREKNGHWKGGFTRDDEGYILFRIPKGCQFFSMKGNNGYVRLHRLMMAEYLQRPLRPEEVVHHKNENITDNRIENFKLCKNNGEHNRLRNKLRNDKEGN